MPTEYERLRLKYQQVLEYLTDQQLTHWEKRVIKEREERNRPTFCGHEKET